MLQEQRGDFVEIHNFRHCSPPYRWTEGVRHAVGREGIPAAERIGSGIRMVLYHDAEPFLLGHATRTGLAEVVVQGTAGAGYIGVYTVSCVPYALFNLRVNSSSTMS